MKTPYKFIPIVSPLYRKAKSAILSVLYSGENVFCPLCKTSFKSWISAKDYGSCPKCGSEARHRLLYLFLQRRKFFAETPRTILHFAPEKCWQNKLKKLKNTKYITADISAPGVDYQIDIADISFDDQSFDVILCSHVLEHIVDDISAIKELFRVVTYGGTAYIQVPYNSNQPTDEDPSVRDPKAREERFGQFDHVRLYGTDLKGRLESAGFKVTKQYLARELSAEQRRYFGLWDDVLFECAKK